MLKNTNSIPVKNGTPVTQDNVVTIIDFLNVDFSCSDWDSVIWSRDNFLREID